jgi:hypothetical protein
VYRDLAFPASRFGRIVSQCETNFRIALGSRWNDTPTGTFGWLFFFQKS